MAEVANRTARIAAFGSLTATFVVIFWAMLANTTGAGLPPQWVLIAVAVANTAAVAVIGYVRRPGVWAALVAAAWGMTVALPLVAVAVHGTAGLADVALPVMSLVAGTAVALAVLAGHATGTRDLLRVGAVAGTVVVWASLLLGVQTALSGPIDASYMRNNREWLDVWQLKGIAGHPNALALICALSLVLQVSVLCDLWSRRIIHSWGLVALVLAGPAVTVATLVWTESRSGWAAAVLGGFVLLLPWRRDRYGLLAAGVGLVLLALLTGPPLVARAGLTFHGRAVAWDIALPAVGEHPLLGPGPALFAPAAWAARPGTSWEPAHAHNALIQSAVLLGLVGALVVVAAWVLAFVVGLRARAADRGVTLAAATALATTAGLEPALGIGTGGAVYLPVLLFAIVLGAAVTRPHDAVAPAPQARQVETPNRDGAPTGPAGSRGLPFGAGVGQLGWERQSWRFGGGWRRLRW